MNLTRHEQRAIGQLRKLERNWSWFRWLILAYGLVALGGAAYVYHVAMSQAPQVEETGNYRVTFFFLYGGLGSGFALLVYIGLSVLAWLLVRWRGDPIRTILIRLLDEGSRHDD